MSSISEINRTLAECLREYREIENQTEHAHWVLNPDGMDYGISAWTCSKCGGRNDMIPVVIPMRGENFRVTNPTAFSGSSYCPHCGAKMDEVTG